MSSPATKYRVTLHRVGGQRELSDASGLSAIITATNAEDAARQAESMAASINGHFYVVDIRPANSTSTPAKSEVPRSLMIVRLAWLMLVGAMFVGGIFGPHVQPDDHATAREWLFFFGTLTGAILGAVLHFRLQRRR